MCECQKRGFTTVYGVENIDCKGEIGEYCKKCVEFGEKRFNEFFNKLDNATSVANTTK